MNQKFLFIGIIIISYLLGSWDLDGLRQGTETFYLKIAREMFDSNSFMIPLHRGTPHWSKPPFVFWLSFPFYFIFSFSHHFAARLSIILSTVLTTYLFSKEVSLSTKKKWHVYFLLIMTSFGFFRFGKIYMMDASLAMFTSLSLIYFYNSQVHHQSNKLYSSILVGAMAILIKGPVALVMIGFALALYGLLNKENRKARLIKNGIFFLTGATALASIWFIFCYLSYGREFIEYFFLRENVGKFASQSYPMRKLFQGLFFYSLPWSFVLFFIIHRLKNFKLKSFVNDRFKSFVFVSFLAFFIIWFIPNQRSHHYALPAIPFFLVFLADFINIRVHKFIKSFGLLLVFLLFSLSLFASYLMFDGIGSMTIVITFIFGLSLPYLIWQFQNEDHFYLGYIVALSIFWSVLLPTYSLPKLPGKAVNSIGDEQLYTVFKKNYYFEQILGRPVISVREHLVKKQMKDSPGYYLFTEQFIKDKRLQYHGEKVSEWVVWKRRVRLPKIWNSILNNDPKDIQEKYVLMHSK